jgi:hypothetical protein
MPSAAELQALTPSTLGETADRLTPEVGSIVPIIPGPLPLVLDPSPDIDLSQPNVPDMYGNLPEPITTTGTPATGTASMQPGGTGGGTIVIVVPQGAAQGTENSGQYYIYEDVPGSNVSELYRASQEAQRERRR